MKQKEEKQQTKKGDCYVGLTFDEMLSFIVFKDKKEHGMKYYITSDMYPVLMRVSDRDINPCDIRLLPFNESKKK